MSLEHPFAGLRVLVTGGARGIGAATALRLIEAGASVAIGARRESSVDEFCRQLQSNQARRVVSAPGRLEDRTSCTAVVEQAVAQLGGLDILINAAGVFDEVPFEAVTQEHWDANFNVNAAGSFFTLQAALPYLEAANGNVVNLGSDAGLLGYPPSSVYSGAKAAVVNMTRALALELAGRVRVNCVCPGNVATEMIKRAAELSEDSEAYLAAARARSPLGRMAHPEEIADAILYLASPKSAFTNGAILSVDGGGVCGF